LAVAVLFGAGNALWVFQQPQGGAPAAQVLSFYKNNSGDIIAGGSMSLIAVAIFVLFASAIREILRELEGDDLLANTAFAGAVLLSGAGLAAETINMIGAFRAQEGHLSGGLARAVFEISDVFGYNAAGVGVGIFLVAVAAVALRSHAPLPSWFALFVLVAGIAFMTPLSLYLLAPAVLVLAGCSVALLKASETA
jgi:hypothetical protein